MAMAPAEMLDTVDAIVEEPGKEEIDNSDDVYLSSRGTIIYQFVRLLFVITLFAHILAMGWHGIVLGSGVSLENYFMALHWAICQFTFADTDFVPKSTVERLYACVVPFLTVVCVHPFVVALVLKVGSRGLFPSIRCTNRVHLCRRSVALTLLILVLSSLLACIWLACGAFEDSWIQRYGFDSHSYGYKFLVALHWTIGQFTFSTLEVVPTTTSEKFLSVMMQFVGLTFSYPVLVGTVLCLYLSRPRSLDHRFGIYCWIFALVISYFVLVSGVSVLWCIFGYNDTISKARFRIREGEVDYFSTYVAGMHWVLCHATFASKGFLARSVGGYIFASLVSLLTIPLVWPFAAMIAVSIWKLDYFQSEETDSSVRLALRASEHMLLAVFLFLGIAILWLLLGLSVEGWATSPEIFDESLSYKLLTSLHWVVSQFTFSTMEVIPQNTAERLFAIALQFMGVVVVYPLFGSVVCTMFYIIA